MATAKTSTAKKATPRKSATKSTTKTKETETIKEPAKVVEEVVEVKEVVEENKTETIKEPATVIKKRLEPNTLIPCKSVIRGELYLSSNKSKNEYFWGDYGEITDVEYQDIMFLKSKKSPFLFKPWFVPLDDTLFTSSRDKELKDIQELYAQFEYMEDFFDLDLSEMREILVNAPVEFQRTAYYTADAMVKRGQLDSLQIISLLNKLLGVQLDVREI